MKKLILILLLTGCAGLEQKVETASNLWCNELNVGPGTDYYAKCYQTSQQIITMNPYTDPKKSHEMSRSMCLDSGLEQNDKDYHQCYIDGLKSTVPQLNAQNQMIAESRAAAFRGASQAIANQQQIDAMHRQQVYQTFMSNLSDNKTYNTRCHDSGFGSFNCSTSPGF